MLTLLALNEWPSVHAPPIELSHKSRFFAVSLIRSYSLQSKTLRGGPVAPSLQGGDESAAVVLLLQPVSV